MEGCALCVFERNEGFLLFWNRLRGERNRQEEPMTGQQNSIDRRAEQSGEMAAALVANEGLVHWTVRRQWLGQLSYQDAVQVGRIALWRALVRYDASRGRLSSYAVVGIERAVWRAARRARSGAAERLEGEITGGAADMAGEIDRVTEQVAVGALVAALPPRLRDVISWRYGLDKAGGATFQEIGTRLGVSKQRAEQLHAEALLRLADPARSATLRRQVGRNEVADYRAYLARRRAWQRRGRSGR